ncbi:MAG: hypothetical protein HQL83_09345 [Magnetococcales bacterium]|nr:hypothetical protein [Magnetococcales bacterium]MBF0347997.1 hypothetical protein [Magnetococcales bacterium]MBF0631304.1 hypothetical protein [Magnetococcales bacterium]
MFRHPAAKRFMVALSLGIVFGFLCLYLVGRQQPEIASLTHPIAWSILTDRILIGMVIAFAGAFTVHPILGFSYRPWLRGSCLGAVVSLPIATGAMSGPSTGPMSPWVVFVATVVSGMIYGAIIDLVATRVGGEGVDLVR